MITLTLESGRSITVSPRNLGVAAARLFGLCEICGEVQGTLWYGDPKRGPWLCDDCAAWENELESQGDWEAYYDEIQEWPEDN